MIRASHALLPWLLVLAAANAAFAAQQSAVDHDDLVVTGRFVSPDGVATPGVVVELKNRRDTSHLPPEHRPPWESVQVSSDPDGRFTLRASAPDRGRVYAEARLRGSRVPLGGWDAPLSSGHLDLGELLVPHLGSIEGHVLASDGRPLGPGFVVESENLDAVPGGWMPGNCQKWSIDDDGSFSIVGIPAGPYRLEISSLYVTDTAQVEVQVEPGKTARPEIEYSGANNRQRIAVRTCWTRFHQRVTREDITLWGPHGQPHRPLTIPNRHSDWYFDGLEDGSYTLVIDDPRLGTWTQDGLRPGDITKARFDLPCSILLSVLDRDTGEMVEDYQLVLRFPERGSFPRQFGIRDMAEVADNGLLYTGLASVKQTLDITAPGYLNERIRVDLSKTCEEHFVEVLLDKGAAITGTVVRAHDNTPYGGARVQLAPGTRFPSSFLGGDDREDLLLDEIASLVVPFGRNDRVNHGVHQASTDERGRFDFFEGLRPGTYTVRAIANSLVFTEAEVEIEGSFGQDLRMELPPMGSIQGSVHGWTPGVDTEHRVFALPVELDHWLTPTWGAYPNWEDIPNAIVERDGSFTLGPLPPGPTALQLVGFEGWRRRDGRTLGNVDVVAGRSVEVTFR